MVSLPYPSGPKVFTAGVLGRVPAASAPTFSAGVQAARVRANTAANTCRRR
jgi:hypothetical protein